MNILSIGGRYKPTNGGNAKRISTMCEAFYRLGNEVTVMTCDGYSAETAKESIENITVLRYSDCDRLVSEISQIIENKSIDIVLVHEETYLRKIKMLRITA